MGLDLGILYIYWYILTIDRSILCNLMIEMLNSRIDMKQYAVIISCISILACKHLYL